MVWHRAEDVEVGLEVFAQVHDGRHVSAAVAVVGSRPDCHNIPVFEMVLRTLNTLVVLVWSNGLPCIPRSQAGERVQ